MTGAGSSTDPRLRRELLLARRYADQGRHAAAVAACRQVLGRHPGEPECLRILVASCRAAGDEAAALRWARELAAACPDDPRAQRSLASLRAAEGDLRGAAESWLRALRAEPERALDWAELGATLASRGREEAAARAFTRAFATNPALNHARHDRAAPPAVRALSETGSLLLHRFHHQRNSARARQLAAEAGESLPDRWERFLARFHQQAPLRYAEPLQRPDYQYYEGLTARPFWPSSQFPWLDRVETETAVIRDEFLAAMASGAGFAPYVEAAPGAPPDWQAMSGQMSWASLHLLRGNRPVAENCARCPRTAALMDELPLARADAHAPEVFFSVLEPGTHIPPHYGVANTKLAIHLPLIVPPDCAIKVGAETRGWTEGQCLVFDDSFRHAAWNRSDERRVVLIFETWHPELTALEIRCLRAIIENGDRWYRECLELSPDALAGAAR